MMVETTKARESQIENAVAIGIFFIATEKKYTLARPKTMYARKGCKIARLCKPL